MRGPSLCLHRLWHCGEPVQLSKKWKIIPFISHLLRVIASLHNEVNQSAKEAAEGQSHSQGTGGWAWDQNNMDSRMVCAAAQIGELLWAVSEPLLHSAPPLNHSLLSLEGAFDDWLLVSANLLSAYLSSVPKSDEVRTVWTGKNVPTWARPEVGDSYL